MPNAACCPDGHHSHAPPSPPPSESTRATSDAYVPRDPTESVLVRTVRKHLPRFLEAAASDGHWTLPAFVEQALRDLALCGDFTGGFSHFECDRCKEPRVVPFSCKGRLCASCGARRMNEFAAYAVDRVLPRCDYRQWVISFPWAIRRTLAFDATIARTVFRIAAEVISAWISGAAAEDGVFGNPAGVLHIQRFGDGLTLNPHGHFVFSDAVFCPVETAAPRDPTGGPPPVLSYRTRPPTIADLQSVADRIEQRVCRFLARHAAASEGTDPSAEDLDRARLAQLAEVQPLMDRSSLAASTPRPASPGRAKKPLTARSAGGFDIHAGVAIPAYARDALERLLRYLARPAVAAERLRELPNGHIAVDLKRAWKNDVRTLTFKPLDFLARLAALAPPPRMHLISYFGVIASRAALRPAALPEPPLDGGPDPVAPARPKKMKWADLLRRVFWIDPLACPCGGRFRLVAVVRNPTLIQAVCAALHLSGHLQENRLPRGPPAHWPPPRSRARRTTQRAARNAAKRPTSPAGQAPRAQRKSRALRDAKT